MYNSPSANLFETKGTLGIPMYEAISEASEGFEVPLISLNLLVSWLKSFCSVLAAVIKLVTVAAINMLSTDGNADTPTIQTY